MFLIPCRERLQEVFNFRNKFNMPNSDGNADVASVLPPPSAGDGDKGSSGRENDDSNLAAPSGGTAPHKRPASVYLVGSTMHIDSFGGASRFGSASRVSRRGSNGDLTAQRKNTTTHLPDLREMQLQRKFEIANKARMKEEAVKRELAKESEVGGDDEGVEEKIPKCLILPESRFRVTWVRFRFHIVEILCIGCIA